MTKIHTLAAAVALSLAAISVQAADVQLYGRVDEGLRYTRTHGQGDDSGKLEMRHNRATSRWGLNITEQISPDLKLMNPDIFQEKWGKLGDFLDE